MAVVKLLLRNLHTRRFRFVSFRRITLPALSYYRHYCHMAAIHPPAIVSVTWFLYVPRTVSSLLSLRDLLLCYMGFSGLLSPAAAPSSHGCASHRRFILR